MDETKYMDILKGQINDLPKRQSKIISIFLSSTFSDMHEERDYLIENVNNRLKLYCKNQYGLEFQVLDMRWGVQGYGKKFNLGSAMCLDEVKRCSQNLASPCFITLLSHRYGMVYLPTKIAADQYKLLRRKMSDEELKFSYDKNGFTFSHNDIVDCCFEEDANSIPPFYNLLSFGDLMKDTVVDFEIARNLWSEISDKLTQIFQSAANLALKDGLITKEQRDQFFLSVTEHEIINGLLNEKDVKNRTLAFIRNIDDIEEYIKDNTELAKRYIDLNANEQVNLEIKETLRQLKEVKVPNAYKDASDQNIATYTLKWCQGVGISRRKHAQYMKKFGDDFFERVKELIDKDQNSNKMFQLNSIEEVKLIEEILTHASFCYESASKFQFRENFIEKVEYYINSNNNQPLIIHGDSGCGKSSLIAKVVHKLKDSEEFKNTTIIVRFLGITPQTSVISSVFKSIIHQLNKIYKIKSSSNYYRDFNSFQMSKVLKQYLFSLYQKHPNEKILIFLDSIDQLNKHDYNLEWVLKKYPANTKFIFSTLSNHGDILKNFQTSIVDNPENYLEIGKLDLESSMGIIKTYLKGSNRSLTEKQLTSIEDLFRLEETFLYPLYVKLVFDITTNWNSYSEANARFLGCKSIDDCVEYIFETMEQDYGKLLVSRCLFYLTSSEESGITNVELEDVLSLDDELLFDIFEFRTPPVRRFPITLWNRIRNHLNEYITLKEVDDTQVYFWYHRRFIEVARKRYVTSLDSNLRDTLYLNLLDVFNETWKDEPKPFKYDKVNTRKKKQQALESEAKRYTSPHPIKFIRNGKERYNMRKLNKVLELSLKIQNTVLRSKILIEKIFLDYDFLYGIFQRYFNAMDYTLTLNYVEELNEFLKKPANTDSDYIIPISILIQLICMYNMNSLNDYPESTGNQLCSRLLGLYGISEVITKFIDDCDVKSLKHCALVAAYQCEPLNNLRTRVLHNFFRPIKANQYLKLKSHIPDFFLCKKSIFLWVWSPDQGEKSEVIGEITLPDVAEDFNIMKIYNLYNSDKYEIIVANTKYAINIDDNGKEKWRLNLGNSDQLRYFSLIGDKAFIVTYENRSYFDLYNLSNKTLIERKKFDSNIIFFKTNRSQKSAWDRHKYHSDLYIAAGLEDSTIIIYKINCQFDVPTDTNIEFKIIYQRKFTNYGLVTGIFELLKSRSASFDKKIKFRFFATFQNMRCVMIEYDLDGNLNVVGLKTIYDSIDEKSTLTILSFKHGTVAMQHDNKLHLYFFMKKRWYTIPGVYSYVTLNTLDNYTIICGIYQNLLNIFLIQSGTNNYKMVHLVQSLQFSDDIFDAGILSGGKLLIILKSGHLLDLSIRSAIIAQHQDEKFDKCSKRIDFIHYFNEEVVMTYHNRDGIITAWAIQNGKIVSKLDTQFRKIHQLVICNKTLFVFHLHFNKLRIKIFSGYQKNDKSEIKFTSEDQLEITNFSENFKIKVRDTENKVLIANLVNNEILNIKCISLNKQTNKWQFDTIYKETQIDPTNYFTNTQTTNHFHNFYSFTHKSNYLILSTQNLIKYINIFNQDIISEFKLPIQEETHDENLSLEIKTIPNSDDIIILYDNTKFIYIRFDSDYYKMNSVEKIYNDSSKIIEWKLTDSLLSFILKVNQDEHHLIINHLLVDSETGAVEIKELLKEKHDPNSIIFHTITRNLDYLITYKTNRLLSLYRLKKDSKSSQNKCIANVPMSRNVNCLLATNQFVVMGTDDKRIISYLIADPRSNDNSYKIKHLESRQKNREITKEDLDECYNCMLQMCCDANDYNWSSIFQQQKASNLINIEMKSEEKDVFKELTTNIKKTEGRCVDEQFDLAIKSLHKKIQSHPYVKVEEKNEADIDEIINSNKSSIMCNLL